MNALFDGVVGWLLAKYVLSRLYKSPYALLHSLVTRTAHALSIQEFMIAHAQPELTKWLRVPNHDRVPVVPNTRMIMPATSPTDLFGRPGESPVQVSTRWRVVGIPSHFSLRITAFIACLTTACVLFCASCIALPCLSDLIQ